MVHAKEVKDVLFLYLRNIVGKTLVQLILRTMGPLFITFEMFSYPL